MEKNYHINTNCVQAGYSPKNGEPRVLPIVQSTTYKYESSEQMGRLFDLEENGYFYTRLQNPTNDAVAARITALEGGVAGMLTSSGQAATLRHLQRGFCGRPHRQLHRDLRRHIQPLSVTMKSLASISPSCAPM